MRTKKPLPIFVVVTPVGKFVCVFDNEQRAIDWTNEQWSLHGKEYEYVETEMRS